MTDSRNDKPLIEFKINDDGTIQAHVINNPGIKASGKTVQEVQKKLMQAIDEYWGSLEEDRGCS